MFLNENCANLNKLYMKKKEIPTIPIGGEGPVYYKMYWCDAKKRYVADCPDYCDDFAKLL